ncbi:MAG TPA: penicillin acylase family protein [Aeromicrobium sp.]|nr:penicillin acylase family protein [Aeromicrobium sp.]
MRFHRSLIATAAAATVLPLVATLAPSASAAGTPLNPSDGTYSATITRTEHGIPHIVADDWGSLGFGHGYATAETGICNLADTLLTGKGERSKYLGADGRYTDYVSLDATNLQTDAFFTDVRNRQAVEKLLADPVRGPGDETRAMVEGYVKGVNQYLADVGGSDGISDERCRGAEWVRPASTLDLWYGLYAANMLASAGPFIGAIADADPPSLKDTGLPLSLLGLPALPIPDVLDLPLLDLTKLLPFAKVPKKLPSADELKSSLGKDPESAFGSNAIAVGSDHTIDGRGMLLGNPHFPWLGRYRFEQVQLTIPGAYDAAGASLMGSPVINIGFNDDVAWSHTVSTGYRFTPYEYRTIPGFPTKYLTDKGVFDLEERPVQVQVKQDDGSLVAVEKTLYRTEIGYVMDNPDTLMGWTPLGFVAMRDANAEQLRTLDSFLEMSKASTAEGLLAAQDRTGGIPWVNTIAADRDGTALYADHSVVPNVPDALVNSCITPIGLVTKQMAGLPILDGTRATSSCAWKTDADASRPGIFGPQNMPSVATTDWVMNANDSYWLPNPDTRLEGFAGIIGCENCERTLRSRMIYQAVDELLDEGPLTHQKLADLQHSEQNKAVILARENDDLAKVCAAAKGGAACDVLASWDGLGRVDSRGLVLFNEFFTRLPASVWKVPFSAADPVNTPRDLKERDKKVVQAMVDAIAYLNDQGVALDATWGSQNVADKPGEKIAIPGGPHALGFFNVVVGKPPYDNPGKALYPINYGSSHVQAVSFTDSGPEASTILTYGQSDDPTSPYFRDQTELFSRSGWVSFPYTKVQIAQQKISTQSVTGRR